MKAMKIRPPMASLLRSRRRQASRHRPRDVRGATYATLPALDGLPAATLEDAIVVATGLPVRDARIDEPVHQIEHGDDEGIHQRRAHDERVVALADALYQESPDARHGENGLDD